MDRKVVFCSYSHDSDAHRERVLAVSERLRADGLDTRLDQYENGVPGSGWPRWMMDQLDAADFVLVVCTETYYRRFRGHEETGKGKGAEEQCWGWGGFAPRRTAGTEPGRFNRRWRG
jgi:SEFIR domain